VKPQRKEIVSSPIKPSDQAMRPIDGGKSLDGDTPLVVESSLRSDRRGEQAVADSGKSGNRQYVPFCFAALPARVLALTATTEPL
jgi:hypothetical protein